MINGIAGCQFMLAPMSDRYVDIILGAVAHVDTSRIESRTGKMGTVYRGRRADVLDAVKACLSYAYQPDVHMTLSMTLSEGCPGASCDIQTSVSVNKTASDERPANEAQIASIHFPVDCKFAYYPMGTPHYIEKIEDVIALSRTMGVFKETMPQATVLKGDVANIFDFFNKVMEKSETDDVHFIYEITFSVNSPSAD